jgi:hypothetical protein
VAERPATGERLACLLDRLDLAPDAAAAPDAADPALRRLFAAADRRRIARCEPPRAVAEQPAPERIPAELFTAAGVDASSTSGSDPAAPPKLNRSRRRERS